MPASRPTWASRARSSRSRSRRRPPAGAPATRRSSRSSPGSRAWPGSAREIVARSYFGTSGAMSAFTLAFQVPNLVRALVADAALSSAFVPVFSELLENRRRREALQLASALAGLLLVALTRAHARLHPDRARADAAVHRRRVHAGARRARRRVEPGAVPDRRAARAQRARGRDPQRPRPVHDPGARAARLEPRDHRRAGRASRRCSRATTSSTPTRSACSRARPCSSSSACRGLRRLGYPLRVSLAFRHDPRVRQVLVLMLPVSLGLGLINVEPAGQLGDRLPRLRARRRPRSTPRSASTCSRRGCSPSRSRPCCSPR